MQKRIQKETGNNCLKRIIVAFLAVIMMTTMLHPQMVQAATGITIESQGNKVLTYKAEEDMDIYRNESFGESDE